MATGRIPTTANSPLTVKGDLFGYSTTQARVPVGNDGETLVADSSTSTGLSYQANWAAGKNKIINGDFGIWQRGTSITVPSGYGFGADRWQVFSYSTNTTTISRQTFTPGTAPVAGYEGQFFARVNSTNNNTYLEYRIEDVRTFAGQTVTLSFWAKTAATNSTNGVAFYQNFGSGGSGTVQGDFYATGSRVFTTSWQRFSASITIPSISGKTIGTNSYLALAFNTSQINQNFDIWGVQLEAGSTATAFQTATGTIQGELAACQRYYQVIASGDQKYVTAASAYTASQLDMLLTFPEMRIAPTLSATTGTGYYKFVRNGGTDAFNSITLNAYTTPRGAALYNNTEISSTAGNAGWVYTDNASSSVALSAEL